MAVLRTETGQQLISLAVLLGAIPWQIDRVRLKDRSVSGVAILAWAIELPPLTGGQPPGQEVWEIALVLVIGPGAVTGLVERIRSATETSEAAREEETAVLAAVPVPVPGLAAAAAGPVWVAAVGAALGAVLAAVLGEALAVDEAGADGGNGNGSHII